MSEEGLALKSQIDKDYFDYHPSSIQVDVLDGTGAAIDNFRGLFDNLTMSEGGRQLSQNYLKKVVPAVTFWSGNASKVTAGVSKVSVNGSIYLVTQIRPDETPDCYQCVIFLIEQVD
jgi:hypothetical protein